MNRKRYLSLFYVLGLSLALGACKTKETNQSLLCSQDSDCRTEGQTDKCEAISGLCVPYYENPNFPDGRSEFSGNGSGEGGIRGAFDCAVDWSSDYQPIGKKYKVPKNQGLATVFVTSPRQVSSCGDEQSRSNSEQTGARLLEGLKTGCSVRLTERPRRDSLNAMAKVIQLGFAQYTQSPDIPVAGFRVNFRPKHIVTTEELSAGETVVLEPSKVTGDTLETVGQMTGRYFELCDADDFRPMDQRFGDQGEDDESVLRLRFIATEGSIVLTEYIPSQGDSQENFVAGRLKGYFDLKLVETRSKDSKPVGQECVVPTDCNDEDGCLDNEVVTEQCYAAECLPLPDPESLANGVGVCGGQCQDGQDCGYHPADNPSAYYLILPDKRPTDKQCIQICSTQLANNSCSEGTTCRPGSDFQSEFKNEDGPARCLDRCFPTPNHTLPADCPTRGARADAGVQPPMMDAGTMQRDGATMPPRDSGTAMPADSGTNMDASTGMSSPLGQSCSSSNLCPANWLCAVQPGTTVSGSTVGFCSKPCMMESECTNGYTGPGEAVCAPPALLITQSSATMMRPRTCGIECGASLLGAGVAADMCPGQMTCRDLVNNANPTMFGQMPITDGMNDYCTE